MTTKKPSVKKVVKKPVFKAEKVTGLPVKVLSETIKIAQEHRKTNWCEVAKFFAVAGFIVAFIALWLLIAERRTIANQAYWDTYKAKCLSNGGELNNGNCNFN